MNEKQIIKLLNDANIVGGRIFSTPAPKNTPLPHGRYSVIRTALDNTLKKNKSYKIRIDLDFWSLTYEELKQIEKEVEKAFRGHGYYENEFTSQDIDNDYQRISITWSFIQK